MISGAHLALFTMAVPDDMGSWGSPESRVTMSGDANLARDLERLFSQLDPNWEGRLSRIFGDVWGHQVAAGLRAGAEQARESAGSAGEMISEFLQENQSPVVRKDEVEAFAEEVEDSRDWLNELENRIRELEDSAK